ncbi:MAG: hypothetical protein IKX83_02765 [Clostridia bacterium]|nr:hypothetical protein [Clostridia bacterium]
MAQNATQTRILREAKRMVFAEKIGDFINDYRQYFRRQRTGYYSDRLVYLNRWLINDEQLEIDAYYADRKARRQ